MVRKKQIIVAVIIAVICIAAAAVLTKGDEGMSLLDRILGRGTKTAELASYVQETSGIDIGDVCTGEEGDVYTSHSEEYAYICLSLAPGGSEVIKSRFTELGKSPMEGNITIPGYEGHDIARKMKSEDLDAMYHLFADGKGRTKTRSMEVYLTHDSEGNEYLYLFG